MPEVTAREPSPVTAAAYVKGLALSLNESVPSSSSVPEKLTSAVPSPICSVAPGEMTLTPVLARLPDRRTVPASKVTPPAPVTVPA